MLDVESYGNWPGFSCQVNRPSSPKLLQVGELTSGSVKVHGVWRWASSTSGSVVSAGPPKRGCNT